MRPMMSWLAGAVALIACAAANAEEQPPSAARTPGQIRADAAAKAARDGQLEYYPPAAKKAGANGEAVIDCAIDADGWTEDCKVVSENPAGLGFGDAALKLAPYFHFKAKADAATPNARRRIPIKFKVP